MTLLDQITSALSGSEALDSLSSTIGTNRSQTDSLLNAALPAVLGGISTQTKSPEGLAALTDLVDKDNGSLVDSAGDFFRQGDNTGLGSKLVTGLFGNRRGAVEQRIGNASGADLSSVTRLLPMIAPVALSWVGKLRSDESLDDDALSEALGELTGMLDQEVSPSGETSESILNLIDRADDDDSPSFVEQAGVVRDAGGLAALIPQGTGSVATTVAGTAAVASGTAAASTMSTQAATDVGYQTRDEDRDRSGLGWLLPALAVLGMLILGLILWQCADNDAQVADVVETAEPEAAEPEVVEPVVAEPEPTTVPDPTPEPTTAPAEPTAIPEPQLLTISELAAAEPDLTGFTGLVGGYGFDEPLGNPDDGPFTVFAPTNASFDATEEVAARLSPEEIGTVLTYHVVDGIVPASEVVPGASFETVDGQTIVIGADGTLPSGASVLTADIEASNGLVHIIEGVMFPDSIVRGLASADVNELFQLEPIQFEVSSAEIRPESVPTLDRAVEVLTNLPTGSVFEVQGHTDSDGDAAFNEQLSDDRAASVVAYLTENGVDPAMLVPLGYGETSLKVDPEITPEDKAMNRRIEFVDISG